VHLGVLGNPGSWYFADIERAARERGHRSTRLDFDRLVATIGPGGVRGFAANADVEFDDIDVVIVRTMPPGSLEQVVFRMDALAQLEAAGKTVLNPPQAIECAVDKYLTTAKLAAAGLDVPQTVVCENAESAIEAFQRLGSDVVVKPLFGAEGRGILRVSDADLALRTFRTLERIDAVLYLQRYVDHEGYDIRGVVLDGELLGGIKRRAEGDFRTNVSRNGRAESYTLSDSEHNVAIRAAQAIGTRFAGVDLLYDKSGQLYVLEVNAVPGWRAFGRATGIDVASELVTKLERD